MPVLHTRVAGLPDTEVIALCAATSWLFGQVHYYGGSSPSPALLISAAVDALGDAWVPRFRVRGRAADAHTPDAPLQIKRLDPSAA